MQAKCTGDDGECWNARVMPAASPGPGERNNRPEVCPFHLCVHCSELGQIVLDLRVPLQNEGE